jgi:hypothetical protein
LNQFADSFGVLKKYVSTVPYNMSDDFNIIWVYSANMKIDTVIRSMSEIIGGGDCFGRSIFLKFEKLFEITMHPNSSAQDILRMFNYETTAVCTSVTTDIF